MLGWDMIATSGKGLPLIHRLTGPNSTLWNIAFSGKAKSYWCQHCFSLSHKLSECDWSPAVAQSHPPPLMPRLHQQGTPATSRYQQKVICKSFNFDPRPGCTFKNCQYEHVCWYCFHDPNAIDRIHKAVFCPLNSNAASSQYRVGRKYPQSSRSTQPNY